MKLTLEKQIPLVFAIAVILLAIVVFFTFRSLNSMTAAARMANHTQDVLLRLDDSLILMLNAETGARGFLISNDDVALEPYVQARQNIGDNLAQLRRLVADNPNQTERIARLEGLFNERFSFLSQMIEMRRGKNLEEVRAQFDPGRGRELSNQIRSLIGEMKEEEKNLLAEREGEQGKSLTATYRMLYLSGFAGIFSLLLGTFAIFREARKRGQAEENLRSANRNLEKRVEERTEEISRKHDELEKSIRRREETESRHRIALEAGNLGTWMLDPKSNRAELDERGLSLFGMTAEDFGGAGEKIFDLIHQEDYPAVEEVFRRSLKEKSNLNTHFRLVLKDGSLRWIQCTGQLQSDNKNGKRHFVGNCRDITEVKETENLIRSSEMFTRSILDSLSAHIAVIDKNGNIVAVNQAWENFAGANCIEEKINTTGIGQNYLRVCESAQAFDEATREIIIKLRAVLDGKADNFAVEYPCHSPTEDRWFILQVSRLKGDGGGAVISHINITDRKIAETELKNSEQFSRSIFENSPDSVHILELDGTILTINTRGLKLMEIDNIKDFVGRKWVELWEPEVTADADETLKTAASGKTTYFEGFRKTAKGTLRYWHTSVAPIFDSAGKPSRLISTSRDITEFREAEREREELLKREQLARKDAEIANRLRDEFLATVSHELRAPLNSILGWARLMEKGSLDEATTEKAVSTIVRNAESQNRLIEDLLDVSRIISGKLRLEVMTIKPINIVEAALENVRPAAEAKGIRLEIKQDADISHISGDPNRLQQVIWNLMSNAIKFTPNDGRVTLEIERDEEFVEIRVRDTGVGIKEEFLPHVFDRFRQADASSIRKFGGLGLGLAIVRHITEMHGGTVEVFSAGEDKGSTFTVRLPLITSPNEDSIEINAASLENKANVSLDGLLILVVDDEEDTRQLLVQSLTFYGATVITASSAAAGLVEVRDKVPDVLVSDIGMPDEDGYSFMRRVRALDDPQQRNITAIALTAFSRAQDRMRALASGFQNHVSKPVEPDELATVIASLTGRLQMSDD